MEDLRNELASVVERLAARVQELEHRVSTLEGEGRPREQSPPPVSPPLPVTPASHPLQQLSLARPGGAMPVIGKVFLGIAGAYLLRAVAESGVFPWLVVVPVALAYAGLWLVWAARAADSQARFAVLAYGITSAFVLTPMLWELTLRFKVLPVEAAAGILVVFVALAATLAWKGSLAPVAWAATLSASMTAFALLLATHELVPFTLALLAMASMTEGAACRDRWRSLRPVAALAADAAVLVLTIVYARAEILPPAYKPVSYGVLLTLPLALFAIYAASTIFRTTVLRGEITFFEAGQTVVAFLLAVAGVFRLTTHPAASPAVGVFCLLLAAACYFAALRSGPLSHPRNDHVFAVWALALLLAGSFLCLPPLALGLWLGLAGLAAIFAGGRSGRWTLGFHGVVYLVAAAWATGLLEYVLQAMAGVAPAAPAFMVWIAAAFAVLGFVLTQRSFADQTAQRWLRFFCGAVALSAVVGLAVAGIVRFVSGAGIMTMDAPRLAVLRTLALCVAALALAMKGARSKRVDLVWLAYVSMAFCTMKLLFEDLRYGTAGSMAVSLFLYGMVWVLVPRLVRIGKQI